MSVGRRGCRACARSACCHGQHLMPQDGGTVDRCEPRWLNIELLADLERPVARRQTPARTQRSNQRAPALKAARRAQDARRDARSALSRGALVADLGAKGVLNLVPDEIKQARLCSAHALS